MQLLNDLLSTAPNRPPVARYTAMNGAIYIVAGLSMVFWPGSMQVIFGEPEFLGREGGLIRVLGMTVFIIGVLYGLGGRGNSQQILAVSILCRPVLVPAAIVPIALAGVFPGLLLSFVALDMTLSVIGYLIYRRTQRNG